MNFSAGKRQGPFAYYFEKGTPKLKGEYNNDLLNGEVTAWYENGNTKYRFHYENGVKKGKSVSYFSNGNLEQEVNLKNELPHGLMKTYYEAGNPRLEAEYNEGVRDGMYKSYHLTGLVAEESFFKDGIQDSVSSYYDNVFGFLLKRGTYDMGEKEGKWVTFTDLGDTLSVYTYQNDTLNGPYRLFFAGDRDINNGDKLVVKPKKIEMVYFHVLDEYGSYKGGKLHGTFETGLFFRAAHTVGQYHMGKKVGYWVYYNSRDKWVLKEWYNENGELTDSKFKKRRHP
jgi:antitoxin component YwqK of YwqJK toxin-antitoxin module